MNFICYISKNINAYIKKENDFEKIFKSGSLWIGYNSNNKFEDDKLFFEDDNCFVFLDGIILNKQELLLKEGFKNLKDFFLNVIKNEDNFIPKLKGSFVGLIYDKSNNSVQFFNDHIGSKSLFYSNIKENEFIVSSSLDLLYTHKKNNDLKNNLSLNGAYMLLSYGYLIHDFTLDKYTKKLLPGSYLNINNFSLSITNYYKISFSYNNTSNEDELIEELDQRFKHAIKLAFDKDLEYNYKHLSGLSGGLDSRMTVWVANKIGYNEQLNFTFSQSNYLDETIAKQIARDLKHEWLFKFLDFGHILLPIEKNMKINGGNTSYFGVSHSSDFYSNFNFKNYGIVHTGQLGDAIIGAAAYYIKDNIKQKLSNINFIDKIVDTNSISDKYNNAEEFFIYNRAINGANSGLNSIYNFTETFSPFYDIDFMNFCFSIPQEKRINHNIYKKWIIKKYPKAANYIWESSKQLITKNNLTIKYKGNDLSVNDVFKIMKAKFIKNQNSNHMNPVDYWYKENKKLKLHLDDYFNDTINLIENTQLKDDASYKYKNGKVSDKLEVVTLLAAIKNYF